MNRCRANLWRMSVALVVFAPIAPMLRAADIAEQSQLPQTRPADTQPSAPDLAPLTLNWPETLFLFSVTHRF